MILTFELVRGICVGITTIVLYTATGKKIHGFHITAHAAGFCVPSVISMPSLPAGLKKGKRSALRLFVEQPIFQCVFAVAVA